MSLRLDYQKAAPAGVAAMMALSAYNAANVDAKLRALLELRVSQINGCAFCLNLHTQEARHAGEDQQRLDVLSAWRETGFFTEKEIVDLTLVVVTMNAWNRLSIGFRATPPKRHASGS